MVFFNAGLSLYAVRAILKPRMACIHDLQAARARKGPQGWAAGPSVCTPSVCTVCTHPSLCCGCHILKYRKKNKSIVCFITRSTSLNRGTVTTHMEINPRI